MDTTLHVALCDSDPGDRRQMERLLNRESDKRINTTGVFYIDTFGSAEAIINTPMLYDAYFLDVTDKVCNSYDIASALREKGILAPIIYCISEIDYRQSGELLSNSVFLNKPIKAEELSLVLDEIIDQKKESYIPTIELRNNYDTFYIEEKDVVYFKGDGYTVTAHMTDGSVKKANTFIGSLWHDIYFYPTMELANKNTIINVRHTAGVGLASATMDDGTIIKCKLGFFPAVKKAFTNYKEGLNKPQ